MKLQKNNPGSSSAKKKVSVNSLFCGPGVKTYVSIVNGESGTFLLFNSLSITLVYYVYQGGVPYQ